MKKVFYLLFASFFLFACSSQKDVTVNVASTTDYDRSVEMVQIPVAELQAKVKLAEGQVYVVKNAKGEVVTSQLTHDGLLIFQLGTADATADFTISAGEAQEFSPKVFGRLIPERYDDFAWENDRVAFRIYSSKLIPIDGPSNGIDFWFKRTNDLKIDQWYRDDLAGVASYHQDHGEGLDDYKVGRTLGGGGMAPFVNDSLWLNVNFQNAEVLENGPLRLTVKFTYGDFDVNGATVSETRTISLDAGSQLTKVTEDYGAASMQVASGIAVHEGDSVVSSTADGYTIYWEKNAKNGDIFVANVYPNSLEKVEKFTYSIVHPKSKEFQTHTHVLSVSTYEPNKPLTYYTGYGWTKFGFENLNAFETYAKNFANSAKNPLKYTIK